MSKVKKCKGTGKAKGFGCGVELPFSIKNGIRNYNAVFGLGRKCGCYGKWLVSTEEGGKILEKAKLSGKKKVEKQKRQEKRAEKSLNQDWAKLLQTEINSIVRTIDAGLSCLATNRRGQMHGGHVYARGGNQTIRYNLHNIHRQCAQSNHFQNDDGKLREGLTNEYGQDYMNFVSELRQTPTIKYSNVEYRDLTTLARKILRELKKKDKIYSKSERIEMRNRVNLELGIYPVEYCQFNT